MSSEQTCPVITLDGPSGTGKGTISLMLANHLNWHYLDSGAIYRALAYAAHAQQVSEHDDAGLVKLAQALALRFQVDQDLSCTVLLNESDITANIRTEICGAMASKIATKPTVRKALLQRQRDFAQLPGLVTDGRDMGTVVFPEAAVKIYLNASAEERARRRYLQLKTSQNDANLAHVVKQITDRDARDAQRACSPLVAAEDAIEVDTTTLTVYQAFESVLQLVTHRLVKLGVFLGGSN